GALGERRHQVHSDRKLEVEPHTVTVTSTVSAVKANLFAPLELAASYLGQPARGSPRGRRSHAQEGCTHAPSRFSISVESRNFSSRRGRWLRSRSSRGSPWTSATFPL